MNGHSNLVKRLSRLFGNDLCHPPTSGEQAVAAGNLRRRANATNIAAAGRGDKLLIAGQRVFDPAREESARFFLLLIVERVVNRRPMIDPVRA